MFSQFSWFTVVIFYKISMNTEVTNTESLLLGKCRLRFLPASGHANFVNQSIHNLVLCVFLLKIPYLVFSHSVVSESLWPRGLQHTRLPCPSPSPGACSNSYPLSQWCHPTISSSVAPFFAFCHKGGVICISDISPGNLDFSLCFMQSNISHKMV